LQSVYRSRQKQVNIYKAVEWCSSVYLAGCPTLSWCPSSKQYTNHPTHDSLM